MRFVRCTRAQRTKRIWLGWPVEAFFGARSLPASGVRENAVGCSAVALVILQVFTFTEVLQFS